MFTTAGSSAQHIALTETYAAHNYHPLDVVLAHGSGAWVTDVEGQRYLDCLSGYSALNFGHGHPRLLSRAHAQLSTLTLTSRAFYNDQLGTFAKDLCELVGKEVVLPMNSGAEAVETAIKVARRWGYRVKGVPEGRGTIITMDGNFHGRTSTIVSFSTDEVAREDYGPYMPGFVTAKYGHLQAIEDAIDETTVGVLFEPIQGEGGVVIPPDGFLRDLREVCTRNNVLMIADEIQSGLGRTGRLFACDHENVVPDIYILGKALGGGIMPVSAVLANHDIMDVITPGSHGSTFGGNPLACAIAHEVVLMLATENWPGIVAERSEQLRRGLEALTGTGIVAVRCRGLWAGIDVDPTIMSGRELSLRLKDHGVLAKETHGSTIRIAPPLVATEADIEHLLRALKDSLAQS